MISADHETRQHLGATVVSMASWVPNFESDEPVLSLVDVADAAHVSYDRVYRDVRTGILPCHSVPTAQRHDRRRFSVTLSDLSQSARPCYRRLCQEFAVTEWAHAKPNQR